MQTISKPKLVDLLRVFDHRKWLSPRIRYASVRCKGDLIGDIETHFEVSVGTHLYLTPRRRVLREHLPRISYDRELRAFLFDGEVQDLEVVSRTMPRFQIRQERTTLSFPDQTPPDHQTPGPSPATTGPSRRTIADAL